MTDDSHKTSVFNSEAHIVKGDRFVFEDGTPVSGAQSITIGFVVPEEDSGITELHLYPIGPWSPDDSFASTPQDDDSIIDRLLAFWHKLINYITELYSYIIDIFVPTFEEVF